VLGTAVTFGEVRGLIALALALIGWRTKSLVEEKFMAEQFGAEYENYKRRVKALIPFVV
jgi:protein-S-isoprenylcysteine O-methyltransferase Ste14